jgi:hypothetical protein
MKTINIRNKINFIIAMILNVMCVNAIYMSMQSTCLWFAAQPCEPSIIKNYKDNMDCIKLG